MSDSYEFVTLVKPEVFVYKIPPLTGNKGHKAADWNLGSPSWTGRLRLFSLGSTLEIRLEDNKTGLLFAKAPISALGTSEFESVSDSSRYFVLKLQNDNGQTAFVGIGFADRSDSFDLNVTVQDHFKSLKKMAEAASSDEIAEKSQDFRLKEGQTITVNFGKSGSSLQKTVASSQQLDGTMPFLPPPPPGNRIKRKE